LALRDTHNQKRRRRIPQKVPAAFRIHYEATMPKLHHNDEGSNFDGKEAARQLYGGPPRSSGDGAKPPPEYDDLFGPPALSAETPREDERERVPFDEDAGFYELRGRCLDAARRYGSPYARLLRALRSVEPLARHRAEEKRGASYKRLCAAAHAADFSERERRNLDGIAEQVGMSDRFAGHILASLKRNEGNPSGGGV
jgi:hypothetical protein